MRTFFNLKATSVFVLFGCLFFAWSAPMSPSNTEGSSGRIIPASMDGQKELWDGHPALYKILEKQKEKTEFGAPSLTAIPGSKRNSLKKVGAVSGQVDSISYLSSGVMYRDIFKYSAHNVLTSRLVEYWYVAANAWVGESYTTYVYDENGQLQEETRQLWDTDLGEWKNYLRYTHDYDQNGQLTYSLEEAWNEESGKWENKTRQSINYDKNGLVLSIYKQGWQTDRWIRNEARTYTYNTNGDILTYLYELWDTYGYEKSKIKTTYEYSQYNNLQTVVTERYNIKTFTWSNDSYTYYSTKSNGNILDITHYLWNTSKRVWQVSYYWVYDYYGNDDVQSATKQVWDEQKQGLINNSFYSYTYDKNGNISEQLYQRWDTEIDKWINYSNYRYEYNDMNLRTYYLSQDWDRNAGIWINRYRQTVSYDDAGYLTLKLEELWDTDNGVWENFQRLTRKYNANGEATYYKSETWDGGSWSPLPVILFAEIAGVSLSYYTEEMTLFYNSVTALDDEKPVTAWRYTLAQNYPNPFNPSTTIRYTLGKPSRVKVLVYNALGQVVAVLVDRKQAAGRYDVRFDAGGLSSGAYFYRIQAGEFSQVRKMMLVK